MRAVLLLASVVACGSDRAAPAPIRFLHTFGPEETELVNSVIADRGLAVDSSLVPFARGQQVIGEILRTGTSCPDLIRIDATWLAGLAENGLLVAAPADLVAGDWLPEASALAAQGLAIPQTVDGLVVVRDTATPAPASSSIADLVAAARAATHAARPHPLGVRVDGYWVVPWLREHGAELATGGIESDGAIAAFGEFAGLFGAVAAPPPPSGSEAPEELRRWSAHDIAYWITGPWQIGALRDRDRIAVSALAHAPRGGQLLVVPKCSKHPADGWKLASELTSVPVATKLAEAFATVPARKAALDVSPALVRSIYAALQAAEPLRRSPLTPLLFDDLNPALAAVVAGDATAEEAIAGVRRGWHRLEKAR